MIQADRLVQDRQVLKEAIARYLPNDASALGDADTYLARKAWDVNGGMNAERSQSTLAFLNEADLVPSGLQIDQLVDLSFLNAVLAKIGRK